MAVAGQRPQLLELRGVDGHLDLGPLEAERALDRQRVGAASVADAHLDLAVDRHIGLPHRHPLGRAVGDRGDPELPLVTRSPARL